MDPYPPLFEPDDDNPYAAPSAAEAEAPARVSFGPFPFTVGDVFSRTWAIFKDRMGLCVLLVVAVLALNWFVAIGSDAVRAAIQRAGDRSVAATIINVSITVAAVLFQTWLGIGQGLALLRIARGQPVGFGDLFTGAPYLIKVIIATILFGLIIWLSIIVPMIGIAVTVPLMRGDHGIGLVAAFAVMVALTAVVVIFLVARLSQYFYLAIDTRAGVIDSLQRSWAMTQGHVITIILLYLGQFAVILAGLLALCVGLVFAVPFCALLNVVTYLGLAGDKAGRHPIKREPVPGPFEPGWWEEEGT